jgi:hypothetical protein
MAVKNARSGNKGASSGPDIDASGSADTDAASIARLIDGDDPGAGIGEGDRASRDDANDIGASEIDGGKRRVDGPLGAGSSSDNHRARARSKRGRTSARQPGAGDGSGSASEATEPIRAAVPLAKPHKVKGVIEEEKVELPASSAELIGDLYSIMFWMVGQVTQVPEWKLRDNDVEDEAAFLGERTEIFIKSLGKRRATNLMKSLGKVGPALGFISAVAMVTVPRVKLTIYRSKHGNPQSVPSTTGNSPAATGSADQSASTSGDVADAGSNRNGAAIRERSFIASDFGQVTQGHTQQGIGDFIN